MSTGRGLTPAVRQRILAAAAVVALLDLPALAGGRSGGTGVKVQGVTRGTATITQTGTQTNITATNGAVINFKSFDIPKGDSVTVTLPSSSAKVYERIGGPATQIDGSLSSNGIVYLLNPSGIHFGSTAAVNMAGLFAVGGLMSDADVARGIDRFSGLTGSVVNDGAIHTSGTTVLAGSSVVNTGSITSDAGAVAMLTGQGVMVAEKNSQLLATVSPTAAVATTGTGDVYSLAMRNGGRIKARQAVLLGDANTAVAVTGTIDTSTTAGGNKGGNIDVTGGSVALTGATVNASGAAGGGTIHIGGDHKGVGPLPSASTLTVDKTSQIHADALTSGNGGDVTLWSNSQTTFDGSITSRGAGTGRGGNAEVSGGDLGYGGTVDLTAPSGSAGSLLLDPDEIIITDSASNFPTTGITSIHLADQPGQSLSITAAQLVGMAKNGTPSVVLEAKNDIQVNTLQGVNFGYHGGRPVTLTLDAPVVKFGVNAVGFSGNVNIHMFNAVDHTGLTVVGSNYAAGVTQFPRSITFGDSTSPNGSITLEPQGAAPEAFVASHGINFSDFNAAAAGETAPQSIVSNVTVTSGNLVLATRGSGGDGSGGVTFGADRLLSLVSGDLTIAASHVQLGGVIVVNGAALIEGPTNDSATLQGTVANAIQATLLPTSAGLLQSITFNTAPSAFADNYNLYFGTTAPVTLSANHVLTSYSDTNVRIVAGLGSVTASATKESEAIGGGGKFSLIQVNAEAGTTGTFAETIFPSTTVDVATAVAANLNPAPAQLPPPAELVSAASRDALARLKINVLSERDEVKRRTERGEPVVVGNEFQFIDDWPRKLHPSVPDRTVSQSRVSAARARAAADLYNDLFGIKGPDGRYLDSPAKYDQASAALADVITTQAKDGKPTLPADQVDTANNRTAFVDAVNRRPVDSSLKTLLRLKELKDDIDTLGLSQAEVRASYDAWMGTVVRPQANFSVDGLIFLLDHLHRR